MNLNKIKKNLSKKIKALKLKEIFSHGIILGVAVCFLFAGAGLIWFVSLKIPDLSSFDNKILGESTKIYDKTGEVLLYDMGKNVRRTVVSLDKISDYIKNATIAIEDDQFYSHNGFRATSFLRAVFVNLLSQQYSQGGSTLTQQVVKNSLLTKDKTITRKIKEIFLALKLEKEFTKDEILNLYLNDTPYGGTIYGVEEATQSFFSKKAKDVSIAESAYIAAIPQAPTRYSPYGNHKDELDARKNLVLSKMLENKMITKEEFETAKTEVVAFNETSQGGIKAPHFVMYIRELIEEKYGDRIVAEGGLKVITTLDYELQKKAEEIVKKYSLENAKKYHATNAGLVTIDAKTGQILVMVGSRDYFDKEVDGNYNIATANRQPGSSFKPFVYARAFEKGYRPETILFDLKTQFSTKCEPYDFKDTDGCYSPDNYDGKFRGPMTLRNALAQSINVPAVKLLYLVGIKDAIETAKKLGISTLNEPDRYGLSLVLGGGEVTLLDMTGAYSVFAAGGEKRSTNGILKIEDKSGNVVEEWKDEPIRVLEKQATLLLTDVLKDNVARTPIFGANSSIYFPDRDVAAKTGTTNNYRDAWVVGYTPQISVGAWVGNNDNSPIDKQVAGYIVAPMWHAFMNEILQTLPDERFEKPAEEDLSKLKPILRGVWKGNVLTKDINGIELIQNNVHNILYWINKENPQDESSKNSINDSQFPYWEYPVQVWANAQGFISGGFGFENSNTSSQGSNNVILFTSPLNGDTFKKDQRVNVSIKSISENQIKKAEFFLNGVYVGSSSITPFDFSFLISSVSQIQKGQNSLKVVATDTKGSQKESVISIFVE